MFESLIEVMTWRDVAQVIVGIGTAVAGVLCAIKGARLALSML